MPTAEKTAVIEQLQGKFDGAAAILLADFTGLNVEQMTELRRKCRAAGVTLQVVKNKLALKAARALELEGVEDHLRGPTAVAVSADDPISPARVLVAFQKANEGPALKLAVVDGRLLGSDEIKKLASLPTRDQLISQVMQLAQAPTQEFVGVLTAILSQIVRTVDAVREQKEKGEGTGGAAA
ncbi:MAG: 50S ribosomal protein L10 [Candidatus Eiseniibacteriota bacterium]